VTGEFARAIELLNASSIPIVSIDLPSGIATDSGAVLGTAIQARYTLCLGLWKLGLLQDQAQPWIGEPHLIPFDIPIKTVNHVIQDQLAIRRLTAKLATACLPLPRSPIAHKYKAGHALLIAGSQEYTGAVLLTGKGAIASGVGMLTLVVPESLKMAIASQLPEALIVAAPQTQDGVIADLPNTLDLAKFDVIACGPGLTRQASAVMQAVMASDRPLVLDADGLNWLSEHDPESSLQHRQAPTLLTPHPGEFRRLFPQIWQDSSMPSAAAQAAAQTAGCELILKGAMSAIAHQDGRLWLNPESTPALARGGSGDVLTGLVAGLAAQHCQHDPHPDNLLSAALSAVWWHAQTGRAIAADQTVLGCAASELANQLPQTLAKLL
jgi:NAD(P)H-hydrate epimerase